MQDESSSSSPADTGDPQRSSRRIAGKLSYRSSRHIAGPYSCWTGGASSVRLSRGIAGCRSRRTQSLPARLPEPSRMSQRRLFSDSEPSAWEPRASPARLMEQPSMMVTDLLILKCLASRKRLANRHGSSWDATDAEVQRVVVSFLPKHVDAKLVKERIEEFETIVKKHWESNEQIVANKDLLLDVFSYVMPCSGKKRTLDGEDDSATQHRSKRSSGSESVDNHLVGLFDQRAAVQEIVTGPLNMEQCTDKLKRCGFSDQLLWHAIDILKVDLELRQVFLRLGDADAKGYILHVLGNLGFM